MLYMRDEPGRPNGQYPRYNTPCHPNVSVGAPTQTTSRARYLAVDGATPTFAFAYRVSDVQPYASGVPNGEVYHLTREASVEETVGPGGFVLTALASLGTAVEVRHCPSLCTY